MIELTYIIAQDKGGTFTDTVGGIEWTVRLSPT